MVLTALAWSSYLPDQLGGKRLWTENKPCDTFWCLMSPGCCPQSRTHLAQHHASGIGQIQTCDLKEMWFEDCQESSKRGAAPQKKTIQEPGVGAVLVGMASSPAGVSTTVTTEGKCSGCSDLSVVQVPGGAPKTLLGQRRPCYPQSSYRKLWKSFKGSPFWAILVLSSG